MAQENKGMSQIDLETAKGIVEASPLLKDDEEAKYALRTGKIFGTDQPIADLYNYIAAREDTLRIRSETPRMTTKEIREKGMPEEGQDSWQRQEQHNTPE